MALVGLLLVLLSANVAHAAEARVTSIDTRITVDEAGRATIEHALGVRVVGTGPLRPIELRGVDADRSSEPLATFRSEDGREVTATIRESERALRIQPSESRALRRGDQTLVVRYGIDLIAARLLVRDGALYRLAWTGPLAAEGLDNARVVFVVHAAQTEPRLFTPEGAGNDAGVLATLRRTPEHDEIELVRPRVAKGQAPLWAIRIDPRAVPALRDATLKPLPLPAEAPRLGHRVRALLPVAFLAFVVLGAVAWRKAREVRRLAARAGVAPKPLLPIADVLRIPLGSLAFAVAVTLQASGLPTTSAFFLVLSMAALAYRAVVVKAKPRGPGVWAAVTLSSGRGDEAAIFDAATRRGRLVFLAALVAVLALALGLDVRRPGTFAFGVLDAAVLLPLFMTGGLAQLPPDLAARPRPFLEAVMRRLSKVAGLETSFWGRTPTGMANLDELRLRAIPKVATPGLVGIELGVSYAATPNGYPGLPEVLVRVRAGSPAAERVASYTAAGRAFPGRTPDERVYSFRPTFPTARASAKLLLALASAFTDRRAKNPGGWAGEERRLPRPLPPSRMAA